MNFGVNFTTKNLLSTSNSQASNFIAQLVAQTLSFLSNFGLSRFDNTICFNLSLSLSLFNNSLTAFFTVTHDCHSLSTGFCFNSLTFFLSFCQGGFTLISSC